MDGNSTRARWVAPFAGAWIETINKFIVSAVMESLPSRERGLKPEEVKKQRIADRRSLRGSVD